MSRKTRTGKAPERLRRAQEQFAAHLRNPEANPPPGDVEDRRMDIYRGLFFRNIRSFLSNNFPVLRKLHTDAAWDRLVREFYDQHRARTPLFSEIPREFLRYLQDQRGTREEDPPFMLELAHYEWVELALSIDDQEIDDVPAERDGDLLSGVPVLSPLAWALSYRYPVQQIRVDHQPEAPPPEPTHLLVYRNRRDQVKFMRLNAISALLIERLKDADGTTGLELLKRIARDLRHPDPHAVIAAGGQLLEDLRERDVILGTRPCP
jgi:hypothetical protein